MIIRAYAKINPFLKITGTRPDGYHDLNLVFLPVTLCDTLSATKNESGELRLSCTDLSIPIDDNNLITKAWQLVRSDFPDLPGMSIELEKQIPSGAGMGGGSADAAAFLKLLEPVCGLSLSREQLFSYARRLGADVPALLLGQPSAGKGIGELLTPLESRLKAELLIVSPGFFCSTKEMYGRFDGRKDLVQPENGWRVERAMREGDLPGFCAGLFNVFEQLLDPEQRNSVEQIKKELLDAGARGALMTGSGSCIFGVFETEAVRDQAAELFAGKNRVYSSELLACNN